MIEPGELLKSREKVLLLAIRDHATFAAPSREDPEDVIHEGPAGSRHDLDEAEIIPGYPLDQAVGIFPYDLEIIHRHSIGQTGTPRAFFDEGDGLLNLAEPFGFQGNPQTLISSVH
jgi:hypothetical protein